MRYATQSKLEDAINNGWVGIIHAIPQNNIRAIQFFQSLKARFDSSWLLAHWIPPQLQTREAAISLYEEAYLTFLQQNPKYIELLTSYKDIWDTALSNVKSGYDYTIQETQSRHLQDIAIRRVLRTLGVSFKGSELLRVRSTDPVGYIFSPGRVPFHKPELITPDQQKRWYDTDSIEHFYKTSKAVVLPPDEIGVRGRINDTPIILTTMNTYLRPLGSCIFEQLSHTEARDLLRPHGRTNHPATTLNLVNL